jgi:CheY-like chemotaxis protein
MMPRQTGKPFEILLVEDNPADIRLTQEAFKRAGINATLTVATNGEVALSLLRREGNFSTSTRPDLILLDLNMPRKDGRAVLREMKLDPKLSFIPVIVLTSSAAEEEVCRSYRLQASCHIAKPVDVATFDRVVRSVKDFWLDVASLPGNC